MTSPSMSLALSSMNLVHVVVSLLAIFRDVVSTREDEAVNGAQVDSLVVIAILLGVEFAFKFFVFFLGGSK